MRKPVDRRSIVDVIVRSLRTIEFAAMFADMFVLIVAITVSSDNRSKVVRGRRMKPYNYPVEYNIDTKANSFSANRHRTVHGRPRSGAARLA
jgi:hypothetical protein